ncbi:hypothetical protein [Phytohabitans aurantiacus]|uniref:Uncharacterized protein n=1 Tax=Phytohabitans aurantiacus TaxID=3016789 RepID=A0ABQ5QRN8_9ACTN|nr:hypothetical protein [Phytohabitans aurantiacus]GLH97285.1 hypothetical protein Pa4123_25600 [Phytohabitans aurantiacus]
MTVWRFAGRLGTALACVAGFVAVAAGPASAAEGVTVQITEVSSRFEAGAQAQMTVVASKRTDQCLKVRWSMVLRVDGMRLNQVGIDRVEENGSFPLDVESDGDEARLTDVQLDPGTLCRGRTVTARYALRFADDVANGRLSMQVGAFDQRGQLLESATVTRSVRGENSSAQPSPSEEATEEPTEEPSEEATEEETAAPVAGGGVGQPVDLDRTSGGSGLLPVGLAIGGMMVFLGLTMLVRTRRKLKARGAPLGRPGFGGVWQGGGMTRRQRR